MKLEVIFDPEASEDTVTIRARERTDMITHIESAVKGVIKGGSPIQLTIKETDYFIPKSDILYFETEDGVVKAHTADKIFTSPQKLFELEETLPPTFLRISKSCIVNVSKVEAIRKNPLGASEVFLRGTPQKVYASRFYYKALREKLERVNSN